MNAADAGCVDPQHRLAMLTSAEALENAGIDFKKLDGSDTGVFAGMKRGERDREIER
jgi:acyl transferase domain-containing protein